MNLVVDIGNTRTKVALFDGDKMVKQITPSETDVDELLDFLNHFEIDYAICGSVREEKLEIEKVLKNKYKYFEFDSSLRLPIESDYATPSTLGKDRVAGVTAASILYPQKDILVVDIGTCITYDIITRENRYKGGSISPGVKMRFMSLYHFTAKLPLVEPEKMPELIGDSTESSIASGVLNGIVEEMNGIIDRYLNNFPDAIVVVTGGDASFFESKFKIEIFAVPGLVLTGLNKILEYNVQSLA